MNVVNVAKVWDYMNIFTEKVFTFKNKKNRQNKLIEKETYKMNISFICYFFTGIYGKVLSHEFSIF